MKTLLVEKRLELFTSYIQELYQMEEIKIPDIDDIKDRFDGIHSNPFMKWKDIYPDGHSANAKNAPDDALPIGFIVIGQYPECHPDADIYIAEVYLKPEYRRKHIMSDVVNGLVTLCGGSYCLFIASKNNVAKQFWFKVFDELGYEQFTLSKKPVSKPNTNFILYGFKCKALKKTLN